MSRQNIPYLGAFALVILSSAFGYMTWEARDVEVTVLTIEGCPEGMVFIADPHLQEGNLEYTRGVIDRINLLKPSLVLIGGDFANGDETNFAIQEIWAGIDAPAYAVLGNHDYRAGVDAIGGIRKTMAARGLTLTAADYDVGSLLDDETDPAFADALTRTLEANGVQVLRNEYVTLDVDGTEMLLVGVDDAWAGMADPPAVPETDAFTLYLIHVPDCRADWDADLILAGHTHGGQFMFPVVQQLAEHQIIEVRGLILNDGAPPTYITRGIGGSTLAGIDLRFNSPPEIVLINPTQEQRRLLADDAATVTVG
ncbi:metallophosphoesterase [Methanoculleus frigidifontis]|uniref:metallophosphoesterase n=1 Tax=Methanoculleus frigidifontis TaxID=2584085 RepID=UPI002658AB70|nr:metallophosphoesterase [Methanoculleus sp. FWC-SCC1]